MKTALPLVFLLLFGMNSMMAQDRTTVRANSIDISDNLDLRAVAYLFGESRDLEDFERRLNDPTNPLSNLDLNNDNQVDYLRVIESVENRSHLIIIQAVIGREIFQDVATVEVDRDNQNRMQVQVVGDVFLYGQNYIYEPVYYHTPIIYNTFWVSHYRPYCSPWYWNYYPSHFYVWNPFPVFYYQNHINIFIGVNNTCHFVNHRRNRNFIAMHHNRRANGYERYYNGRSFEVRNRGFSNRHELAQNRDFRVQENGAIRNGENVRNQSVNTRSQGNLSSSFQNNSPRTTNNSQTNTPRPSARTNGNRDIAMTYTPRTADINQNSNVRNTSDGIASPRYNNTNVNPRPRVRNSETRDISFSNTTSSPSFSENPRPRTNNVKSYSESPRPRTNNVKSYSGNTSNNSTFEQPRNNQNATVNDAPKLTRSNSTGISANSSNSYNSSRPEEKGATRSNMSSSNSSTRNSGQSSNRSQSITSSSRRTSGM